MKKIINVALFIFFAVTVAILVAGLLFYQNNQSQINPNNKISPSPNCNLTITTAEMSKEKIVEITYTKSKRDGKVVQK